MLVCLRVVESIANILATGVDALTWRNPSNKQVGLLTGLMRVKSGHWQNHLNSCRAVKPCAVVVDKCVWSGEATRMAEVDVNADRVPQASTKMLAT